MISLTELAISKIKEIAEAEGIEKLIVRAKVIGGGCHGMQNDLSFDEVILDMDEVSDFDGVQLVVDPVSLVYLENATIDYVEVLMGGGFKFTSPDITGSCGCGKSVSY